MTDEVKPDPKQAPTQDAQLAAENMTTGQEAKPTVDFDADYAAAQQMSVSDIDRTGAGAKAAAEVTSPELEVHKPEETKTAAQPTGDPADYMGMAEDASPTDEGVTNVSDDLVHEALDMGKPGQ